MHTDVCIILKKMTPNGCDGGIIWVGMKKGSKSVNLFQYLDYRSYLKDYYEQAKKTRAGFSLRYFSQKAGFGSSNFFKLVMDGDRNLTAESLVKFMQGLGFNKQEREFFRNLVFYTQAKTQKDKQYYYQRILRSKKFVQLKPIDKDQFEYCSQWYHAVIRELINSHDFDGTAEWLASHIEPLITPAQASKSLEVLEKLGFIKKVSDHEWKQTSPLVSTGSEVTSLALFQYHLDMLDLTKDVLETVSADRRDISSMTLGVTHDHIPQLKQKIQEFRSEIMKLVSTDAHPDDVVQVNIQMFPLTKETESGEK